MFLMRFNKLKLQYDGRERREALVRLCYEFGLRIGRHRELRGELLLDFQGERLQEKICRNQIHFSLVRKHRTEYVGRVWLDGIYPTRSVGAANTFARLRRFVYRLQGCGLIAGRMVLELQPASKLRLS